MPENSTRSPGATRSGMERPRAAATCAGVGRASAGVGRAGAGVGRAGADSAAEAGAGGTGRCAGSGAVSEAVT